MTTPDEPRTPVLPVFLVEWTVPRQQRDAQKAAAAVGAGSLVQLVRTVLAELHQRTNVVELGDHTPRVDAVVGDRLEEVRLSQIDASWDRVGLTGGLQYCLDHPGLSSQLYLQVVVLL